MTERSARYGLPLLAAGQAQKELFHNEALILLDLLVQPSVASAGTNHPPASPVEGAAWIVGDAPEGDWEGQARMIACWSSGGWRFVAPRHGSFAYVEDRGLVARYVDDGWRVGEAEVSALCVGGVKVVGEQAPAINAPSGGATIDGEARAAITALLSALRAHGLIAA